LERGEEHTFNETEIYKLLKIFNDALKPLSMWRGVWGEV